jgi:hypothetical protein
MTTPIYSAYVLRENGTWDQPSFRLFYPGPTPPTTDAIERAVKLFYGGFAIHALLEDEEASEEYVDVIDSSIV